MAYPTFSEGTTSYPSLAYADSYFDDQRPDAVWSSLSDESKQGALMYATEYLDGKFSWRGTIENVDTQSLGWPRYSAKDHELRLLVAGHPLVDTDGIPFKVKNATCEMALAHAADPLNATETRGGGEVKSVKVGPIRQEFFEEGSGSTIYPIVKKLLRGLTRGTPGVVRTARS